MSLVFLRFILILAIFGMMACSSGGDSSGTSGSASDKVNMGGQLPAIPGQPPVNQPGGEPKDPDPSTPVTGVNPPNPVSNFFGPGGSPNVHWVSNFNWISKLQDIDWYNDSEYKSCY